MYQLSDFVKSPQVLTPYWIYNQNLLNFYAETIDDITSVLSFLHKLVLSSVQSEEFDCYAKLKKIFTDLHQALDRVKEHHPHYKTCLCGTFRGTTLLIFMHPKKSKRFMPKFLIEVPSLPADPVKWLMELDNVLPNLRISSFEFATDYFCSSPAKARALCWIFIKNLFFPWKRKVGGVVRFNDHYNQFYQVAFSKNLYAKVYERGSDDTKGKGKYYWNFVHVDRVRIEFTFRRANGDKFRKLRIDTLRNFIFNLNIHSLLHNAFKFCTFKDNSSKVPSPKKFFLKIDDELRPVPFHAECLQLKKVIGDIYKFRRKSVGIKGLEYLTYLYMSRFGYNWKANLKQLGIDYSIQTNAAI